MGHFGDVLSSQSLKISTEKLNQTQQSKHASVTKYTTTQNKPKKLKPCLVASYDLWPGNGEGLFWFWCFVNLSLTYLLRHLPTYLELPDTHGAYMPDSKLSLKALQASLKLLLTHNC